MKVLNVSYLFLLGYMNEEGLIMEIVYEWGDVEN